MAHAKAPSLQESQKEVSLSVAEAMILFYRNGIRGYFADPGHRLDFLFLVCLSIADVWILAQIDLKADMNGENWIKHRAKLRPFFPGIHFVSWGGMYVVAGDADEGSAVSGADAAESHRAQRHDLQCSHFGMRAQLRPTVQLRIC